VRCIEPENTSILHRRPSLVITEPLTTSSDMETGNNHSLRLPPTSEPNTLSPHVAMLKSPSFLKGNLTPMTKRRSSGSFRDMDEVTTPDSNPKSPATVEFKLVEDLRLVTIPVTSCLMILVGYVKEL
jgi:hypothetical protein